MTPEEIAAVCHEANRVYCQALGDASQPAWGLAPRWQRDSAINGVQFHLENPDAGPEASHNNWLAEKVAAGWSYGPVKDAVRKQHPCFVLFDDLPPEQQAKDRLFSAIVRALADVVSP